MATISFYLLSVRPVRQMLKGPGLKSSGLYIGTGESRFKYVVENVYVLGSFS